MDEPVRTLSLNFRKLKASEVVRGELVDRGHKTPKSQGGSNTDLTFQGKKSNLSYGANSL